MATATIGFNTPTLASQTPWWRRRDPYVLVPLVAVQATLAGPFLFRMYVQAGALFPADEELFMGFVFAQCLLLGIWAALGCLPLLVRWTLVSGSYLLGVASLATAARQSLDSWIDVLQFGMIGAMLVTVFAAVLLPLRGLLAWRLDFDSSRHAPMPGRRWQLGFMSIAAFSLAIAAPLTIVRLIVESSPEFDAHLFLVATIGIPVMVAASALPAAHAILSWPRWRIALLIAQGWCAIVASSHFLIGRWITALSFFNDQHDWFIDLQQMAAFHAGIAACIIPTFAALRLGGLKLFALRHVDRAFADPCHPRSSAAALPPHSTLPKAA